jgi:arylsulfatase A-like enzyme
MLLRRCYSPTLRIVAALVLATGSLAQGASSAPAKRIPDKPNIVFIIADQWRAQAFGFAGDPNVKTPHLDRFERDCVNFTQAVSRQPVCTPARASLLTGQRPLTHGLFINDVPLKSGAVTLAEVLSAAGYATGCIGKWHVDGQGRSNFIPRERRQGFEYWKVLECTHAYNNSAYYADGPEKLKWYGYDAIAQTKDANAYIKSQAQSGRPFLLWLAWGPPHNPYETAPVKYREMYQAEKLELRGNVPPEVEARTRKDLAGYYAHCTALDACFGELLETLRASGVDENTLIVFTSDHGDMLGSHALIRKQKPFEESVRVPMLFRLPAKLGIKPKRVDGTINTEDVMPTLLRLCGLAAPKSSEGLDFTPYLRGGKDPSGGAAVIQCPAPFGEFTRAVGGKEYRGIRTKRFTYVRDLQGPWLLYDNEKDPLQRENVVGTAGYAAEQARLDLELKRKLALARDEFRPAADYIATWGYKINATGTMPYTP